MPICNVCSTMKATSEMRRKRTDAKDPGWVCRDKEACKRRRKK